MEKKYLLFWLIVETYTQEYELVTSPQYATVGEDFELNCKTNDTSCEIRSSSYGCVFDRRCKIYHPLTCRTYACDEVANEFTLRIPAELVKVSFHYSSWRCSSRFGTNPSDYVTMYVKVPISKVHIEPLITAIAVGSNQNFTCTTDAGRPNAIIQWYLSNGTNLTVPTTIQHECGPKCNTTVVSTDVFMYTGKLVDHGETIYCTASNENRRRFTSEFVNIVVLYGPTSIEISPATQSYTVTEITGSIGPITCTANCRPNCTITWSGPYLPDGTTAELNLQSINRNQAGYYHCTANNSVGSMMSGKVTVTVEYKPTSVVLSPSTPSYLVTETIDSVGPITCTADCKPNCTITWRGPNLLGATSVLTLSNTTRNQSGIYRCTANNSVGSETSAEVLIIVNYGPHFVSLHPPKSSYIVTEKIDSVGPITCIADCIPKCTMIWNGPNLPDGTTSVLSLANTTRNQSGNYQCTANNSVGSNISDIVTVIVKYGPMEFSIVPDASTYTVVEIMENVGPITCLADCRPNCTMTWSGPNLPGGTTSVLNLQNINRNQAGDFKCRASNDIGSLTSEILVTVIVKYGPNAILLTPSTQSYTVTETKDSVELITCTADCRPKCTLTWSGPNLPAGTTSELKLQNINRNQAGSYRCSASNIIDNLNSSIVTVVVNYVPTITSIEGNLTYYENDTAELRCLVDSVPKSLIKWKFTDRNMTSVFSTENGSLYLVDGSVLKVFQMNCLSTGSYSCEANNGIGVSELDREVMVMCAPRLNTIEYEIQSHIAVRDNQPLHLTVPVLAYPKPYVHWQFIRNGNTSNVTGEITSTSLLNRHNYTLFIQNMTEDNFGFYEVYAENGIRLDPNYIGIYEVQAARRPDKPSNVTCLAGNNYVVVNWKSEFNGGSPQHFRVFYKSLLEHSFKEHKQSVREADYQPFKIVNLPSMTMYLLRVHAVNIYNTTVSDEIYCNTTAEDTKVKSFIAVGVGAGVGSALGVVCVVLSLLYAFRRLRKKTSKNDKEPMKCSNEEEENDGLKDNPLYVSFADDVVQQNAIDSTVSKEENQVKRNKPIEMGCVYENHDDFIKGNDQIYANQQDPGNKAKEYNPTKNKDGLIYADLDLAPISSERRFTIRGLDNKNNYAMIDLYKKADPLPSDDDDETNGEKTEK